jgi:uncharacterized surface protein with fasciclin (FAS1) repeats
MTTKNSIPVIAIVAVAAITLTAGLATVFARENRSNNQTQATTNMKENNGKGVSAKPGKQNIVEIVLKDDGEFDVLQEAVIKAGLVDALSGKNQLTVFAPTDAAFVQTLGVADEAVAIVAVESLELEALTNILLYHVTEGRRTSTSVLASPEYMMLNGDYLTRDELSTKLNTDMLNISASNGIIHVLNEVLIPSAE